MRSKKLILFASLLVLVFFLNGVEADSCNVVEASSCNADNVVMELSSTTNAHGAVYGSNYYPYVLCCDSSGIQSSCQGFPPFDFCPGGTGEIIITGTDSNGCAIYGCREIVAECQNFPPPDFCPGGTGEIIITGTDSNGCAIYGCKLGVHTCSGNNNVLKLSDSTNAHAEIPTGTAYSTDVCYGYLICEAKESCAVDEECVVTLSSDTNAHLATCSSSNAYDTKICCVSEPCKLTSAEWSISEVTAGTNVNLIVHGTGYCSGQNVVFNIGEIDFGSTYEGKDEDDTLKINVPQVLATCSGGICTASWATEWILDENNFWGDDDPEYVFKASLVSNSSIFIDDSGQLKVLPGVSVPPACTTNDECWLAGDFCDEDCTCHINTIVDINNPGACVPVSPIPPACTTSDECWLVGDKCLDDCTCEEGYSSNGVGSCGTAEPCDLTSAKWNILEVVNGTNVDLIVDGTNCEGKIISFEIYEDDVFPLPDTSAREKPDNVFFNGNSATGTWTAEWIDDGIGQRDPEYYFKANVVGESETKISSTNSNLELKVSKKDDWIVPCDNIEVCSDYLTESECESDDTASGCGVAYGNVQASHPYINCGVGYSCSCIWDGVCKSSFQSLDENGFVGICLDEMSTDDDCDDGFLSYSWTSIWEWGENNGWIDWNKGPSESVEGDYESIGGLFYYDPYGAYDNCQSGSTLTECSAGIQVGFFGSWNFVIAIIILVGFYFFKETNKK